MVKSKNTIEYFVFFLLLFLGVYLTISAKFSYAVIDGVKLWVATVIPALFPYFFITAVLSSLSVTGKISLKLSPITRRVFNTGGAVGYAFFMSTISGYPIGAKIISDLKSEGAISETESIRASAFCSNSSPMFMIASVGGIMFNDITFGYKLFLCSFLLYNRRYYFFFL